MLVNSKFLYVNTIFKTIVLLFYIVSFVSCIEEFNPELGIPVDLLVVDGSIIKGDNIQKIVLSRSTSVYDSQFIPISGCSVWVMSSNGEQFVFDETQEGVYTKEIPQSSLIFGEEYKLQITTPDGKVYESAYEKLLESSPVDSVYYEKSSYSTSSVNYDDGFQFYTDLKAPEGNSKNYRWRIEETWEYRSHYVIAGYWNYDAKIYDDWFTSTSTTPLDTFMVCYNTKYAEGIYTSTTSNLTVNEKKKIKLNYVSNYSEKVIYNYSILVKQFALGAEAYEYWNQNQIQISESGGLYQTQPSQTKSNIRNLSDETEKVLGYFWVSSYSEKRYILDEKLYHFVEGCDADTVNFENIRMLKNNYYIGLIGITEGGGPILGHFQNQSCVDCRAAGGTIKKPDFFN